MRTLSLATLVAAALFLSSPPLAAGTMQDGGGPTAYLTDSCGLSPPTGCMSPESIVVPGDNATVVLTLVNNATGDVRIDACMGSGSSNATSGSTMGATYAACPTPTGGSNATGAPSTLCSTMGSGNSTAGSGGMNATNGSSGAMSFPVTVPGCGMAQVSLTLPAQGAVSLVLADNGVVVGTVSMSPSSGMNNTTTTPFGGTTTTLTTPTTTTQESTGGTPATTSRGTPGFGLPLAVAAVAAALVLSRRKK